MEVLKFRHDFEGYVWRRDLARKLIDQFDRRVAQKFRGITDVGNPFRLKSHEPRARCIRGYGII